MTRPPWVDGMLLTPFTRFRCEDPTESDTHIAWAREFMGAMEPFTIPGVSLNFSADQSENKVKAFFGPEKYERLVALKDKYDPVNLFRLNQNIKPSQELPQPVS